MRINKVITQKSCEVRQRGWNWLGHILKRECERLLYSIMMDSRRSEGERKTTNFLEKDS